MGLRATRSSSSRFMQCKLSTVTLFYLSTSDGAYRLSLYVHLTSYFIFFQCFSINLINVIAIFLRIIFLMVLGLRASKNIFKNLLDVVMYAPMSFFDTTPIGRIINRFSQDMYTIDSQLMTALRSYLVRAT